MQFCQRFLVIKNAEARILLIGETKVNFLLEEKINEERFSIEKYDYTGISDEALLSNRIRHNDFIILSQNLHISPVYEQVNNFCEREGKCILNISFDSEGVILGPFIKKDTPFCFSCYKKRVRLNQLNRKLIDLEKYYSTDTFRDSEFQYLLEMDQAMETVQIILEFLWAENEILKTFDDTGIYYYNFKTLKEKRYDFYKVYAIPGCDRCDKAELPDLYMEKAIMRKEDTCKMNLSFINKKAGIFRRLIDAKTVLKGTDIYYYTIQVPSIYEAVNEDSFSKTYQYNIAGGVSVTREAALGKAIGEACERYCLEAYKREELLPCSVEEIKNRGLLYLKELQLFADWQYNGKDFAYKKPTDDLQIYWTVAREFYSGNNILVPASFIYTRYGKCQEKNGIGRLTTSGAACSTDIHSAILYAVLELLERDSTMITWLQKLNVPKVLLDIHKLKGKRLLKILELLKDNDITIEIFYITLDLEMPCFLVIGTSTNEQLPEHLIGAGCRPDAEEALTRALEEIIQGCGWAKLHEEIKLFDPGEHFENVTGFQERVSLYARKDMKQHLDFLHNTDKTIQFQDIPSFPCTEEEAFGHCLDIIKKNNMSLLVKDLTTSDIRKLGFVVVKVLIPELQQIEADYNYRFLNNRRVMEAPEKSGFITVKDSKVLNTAPHPFP